ncbi:MAG: SH3 domain-containing protein [Turicibacter sp.]|nr:SH3 domain-containing protein [Turicibacter sp.]
MNPKNKDEFNGRVTSWTQTIGISMIGTLTAVGMGLILYTSFKAATYEAPKSENEFLIHDDIGLFVEPQEEMKQETAMEAYCNIDGVNIRKEPATGTEIIGNLDAGDIVTVLDRYYSEEWAQVSFEGEIGYVYIEYLTFES